MKIGDPDIKLGGQPEREVQHPLPGHGGMSARKAAEPLVEHVSVWLCADARVDENPALIEGLAESADHMGGDVGEIRLAACEKVRAGLSKEVLHARGEHESKCEAETESHPADVPFP